MDNRVGVESLVAVLFIFIMFSLPIVHADYQVDALYAFKQKISDDPRNVTQSWDPSLINPCTWYHIGCDADNRVIRIDLGDSGLSGQLVPELGQLKDLQYLELYDNHLTGQIPKEIGNICNLISLDLHTNNLSGPIPDTLGSLEKLRIFRIEDNKLTGPVPLALPSLKYLSEVSVLGGNDVCGPFTARCIDPKDPKKCTDDYRCPCRCGPTFSTPCDYDNIPLCNITLCCWN